MSQFPNNSQVNPFGSNYRPSQVPLVNNIDINVPNNSQVKIDFYINNPPPHLYDQTYCNQQPIFNADITHQNEQCRPNFNEPFSVPSRNKSCVANYAPSNAANCNTNYLPSTYNNAQLQQYSVAQNPSSEEFTLTKNADFIYNTPSSKVNLGEVKSAPQWACVNKQNNHTPNLVNIEWSNNVNNSAAWPTNVIKSQDRENILVKSEEKYYDVVVKTEYPTESQLEGDSCMNEYSTCLKESSYNSSNSRPIKNDLCQDIIHRRDITPSRNNLNLNKHSYSESYYKRRSRSISPRERTNLYTVSRDRFSEKKSYRSCSRSPSRENSKERRQQHLTNSRSYREKRSHHSPSSNRKHTRIDFKEKRHMSSQKLLKEKYSENRSCLTRSVSPRENGNKTIGTSLNNQNSTTNEKCLQKDSLPHTFRENSENESQHVWTRTAPAELYYKRQKGNPEVVEATEKLDMLCEDFEELLVKRAELVRAKLPKYVPPPRKRRMKVAKHKSIPCSSSSSGSESEHEDCTVDELERKKLHPYRLHPELWYNDPGEVNDGPLCRCSARARRSGIRHNIYAGESSLKHCNTMTNNADKLFHYRITISPPTNFLIRTPTIINYDEHEYIFEGFSMLSHGRLHQLPVCKVIRFNIEYTILYEEEKLPENFTIQELDLFYKYLFHELLELVDLDLKVAGDSSGCAQFHFMPRFVRELPDNGKEILPMNEVLKYLIKSSKPLIDEDKLEDIINLPQHKWQNFTEEVKGMVVTYPGRKPCSLRVDQLDRDQGDSAKVLFPEIVHFGIRPPQLSYAGNPEYQKAWREYVKFRHLLANMPKPDSSDKRKLQEKENRLQDMRTQSKMKRDVTVTVSSEHFNRTGIMCDIVQHAMLIPVLVSHLRFHRSLDILEKKIDYQFKNRYLLQLALTHPSYRENFGTNPDHARNSLTNCGIRQPVYGDRRIHYMNTRKRGINTLINIMSRFGKKTETESNITHNERLEFLGDAVVEFVTSIHLFHMFPDLEEGGLATYRAAIVQNQHLALLAKTLSLEEFMLYAHGSDLCHDLELRHAMANCFEALMGALFLDGGIQVADKVFGETLFKNDDKLLNMWVNYPPHPLQEQEPLGDRRWIPSFVLLQNLAKFEESIGVVFNHIRLLARAFTDRSIGFTNLTLGSNQRLEFLGDTVLQLIASEYLYKYFPEHHEGHLSLLRSSLVNNSTQSVVCNDLGMASYALYSNPKAELKTKDRADLLEAFLGALYVDKGLDYCRTFCSVCFFPRLQDFIMHQDWNDPKSKLQQCCLTLRTMEGGEPEIPVYKVIECMGPTNTRIYTVAVYFKGQRLAKASGHSIQQAEKNAAQKALELSQGLFPQLDHQKRVISKSMKRQRRSPISYSSRFHYRSSSHRQNYDRRSRSRTRRSSSREIPRKNSRSYRGSSSSCQRDRTSGDSGDTRQKHSSPSRTITSSQNKLKRQRSPSQGFDIDCYNRDQKSIKSNYKGNRSPEIFVFNTQNKKETSNDSSEIFEYKSNYQNVLESLSSCESKSNITKVLVPMLIDSQSSLDVKSNVTKVFEPILNDSHSSLDSKINITKVEPELNDDHSSHDSKNNITKVLVPMLNDSHSNHDTKNITLSLVPSVKTQYNDCKYNQNDDHKLSEYKIKIEDKPFLKNNTTENSIDDLQSNNFFSQGSSVNTLNSNYINYNDDYNWQYQSQLPDTTQLPPFNIPPPCIYYNAPPPPIYSGPPAENIYYDQYTSNNSQNYTTEAYNNYAPINSDAKDNFQSQYY